MELVNNKYNSHCEGPFVVQIEKAIPAPHRDELSIGVLKLASALNRVGGISKHLNVAFDFKWTGFNKFNISFPSSEVANDFVNGVWLNRHLFFDGEIWIASVPLYKTTKKVILLGVANPNFDLFEMRKIMRSSNV